MRIEGSENFGSMETSTKIGDETAPFYGFRDAAATHVFSKKELHMEPQRAGFVWPPFMG